jgi:hypothetical protein
MTSYGRTTKPARVSLRRRPRSKKSVVAKRVAKRTPKRVPKRPESKKTVVKRAITVSDLASFIYGKHRTLVQASRHFRISEEEIKKRLAAKRKRDHRRAITVESKKVFTDKKVGRIRTHLMKQKKDVQLHKWRAGVGGLDNARSKGRSIRFSVRRRLTPQRVERVMYRMDQASVKLARHKLPLWTALMSFIVMGHSRKLPGYQPLNLRGLPKSMEGYVSYASTGPKESREGMLQAARHELEELSEEPVYISLEQVSVSTYRQKNPVERLEFLVERQRIARESREALRKARKRGRGKRGKK